MSVRSIAAAALAVGLVTAAVFWPVLSCQALCFDDVTFLFSNPVFQNPSWNSAGQVVREVVDSSVVEGYYEPLTLLSLMLDVKAGGHSGNLLPFHRTSLILHVVNAMLVSTLVFLLFREAATAVLVGVLFGVHPLCVEPVAWVWERKTPLATAFALACLVLYVLYVRRRDRRFWAASLGMLVLSLLSKPSSLMVPPILLLMDIWPLKRFSRATLLEKGPYFILSVLAGGVAVVSTARTSFVTLPWERTWTETLLRVLYLPGFYVWKILRPTNLTPLYELPAPFTVSNGSVVIAAGLTLAISLAVLAALRWSRGPVTGWLMFLVLMFPTLGVVGYSWVVASDKYVYLPAIGLLLPLAWLIAQVRKVVARRLGARAGIAVLVACGLVPAAALARLTWLQLSRWRTTETLGRHVVTLAPGSSQGYVLLASAIREPGRTPERIELYEQALRLSPGESDIRVALARVLSDLGRDAESWDQYIAAIGGFPDDAQKARVYHDLGMGFARKGSHQVAVQAYRESLRVRSDANTWYNLGNALSNLRQWQEAVTAYREAARLQPEDSRIWNNLGNAQFELGRIDESLLSYRESLRLRPGHARAHANLADALLKKGDAQEALEHLQRALAVEPRNAGWHVRMGAVFEALQQMDSAAAAYRQALSLNPQHGEARRRLEALAAGAASAPADGQRE